MRKRVLIILKRHVTLCNPVAFVGIWVVSALIACSPSTVGSANIAPVAHLSGPAQGTTGESLAFDGSTSSDADGSIVSFTFDFGDGIAPVSGTASSLSHGYTTPGTFTVKLTVIDDKGATGSTELSVVIVESPGPICGNSVCEVGECESCPGDCEAAHKFPSGLTDQGRAGYAAMSDWLDSKMAAWKPATLKPMDTVGFHMPLTSGMRCQTDSKDDANFVALLDEMGVTVISVGVVGGLRFTDPLYVDRLDAVFSDIRTRGKKLKIWLRRTLFERDETMGRMVQETEFIIDRWHPEFFSITHEPKVDSQADRKWVQGWVEASCKKAKEIDGNVFTSATAINYSPYIDIVDDFVQIDCLDGVGFDIYNTWGMCPECDGGDAIATKAKVIKAAGKKALIEETWLSSQWLHSESDPTRYPGVDDPNRAWWDARFMKVITYFAQRNDIIAVEPWFIDRFVFYPAYNPIDYQSAGQCPGTPHGYTVRYMNDLRNAMKQSRRTPTYCAFREMAIETAP